MSPAELQLALARELAGHPDVWMAERDYQRAVKELREFWDEKIVGSTAETDTKDIEPENAQDEGLDNGEKVASDSVEFEADKGKERKTEIPEG